MTGSELCCHSPAPVGVLYDERMCRHENPDGTPHPECPDRIRAIWNLLESSGIHERCQVLKAEAADEKNIALVHTEAHIDLVKAIGSDGDDPNRRQKIASKFNSIYLNEGSSESAFLAAGGVLKVAQKVADGELRSGIALVRPPGHHAEPEEMMGFCIFNNIAIAASYILNARPDLGIKKILIVDWDVHHGNGTQKVFYDDPRVLFFSIHRFDNGSFYPAGYDGSHVMTGQDLGAGYNINVPWEHGKCGDADYLAVWDYVLLPVAEAYKPDIIFISAGFDAAIGDPLGGCCVSPYGYSVLLYKLMGLAQGKIVMALEGGYNLKSIARSVFACVEVLLGKKPAPCPSVDQPFESTFRIINDVVSVLCSYWPTLPLKLPDNLLVGTRKAYLVHLSSCSDSDNEEETFCSGEHPLADINMIDIGAPLTNLSLEVSLKKETKSNNLPVVENQLLFVAGLPLSDQMVGCSFSWRSLLSKTYIWYGSYGSNMWMPRFLCYLNGGQEEGMKKPCSGANDKTMPKSVLWITVPHRLFFSRSHTDTWGAGGVAFLHPVMNINDKAYICLYKITLEQFNDILRQENCIEGDISTPLVDQSVLNVIEERKTLQVESLMETWYSNVLYLGEQDDTPILTMTCPSTHLEGFMSGELPGRPPSKEYVNTLVRGLVEGKQLSEEEAMEYIHLAGLPFEKR